MEKWKKMESQKETFVKEQFVKAREFKLMKIFMEFSY